MYDNLSKYEMNLRQGKVDISQGAGNSLKCAIDFVKAFCFEDREKGVTPEEAAMEILKWQKVFLIETNDLIEKSFASWLESNNGKLREQFQIEAIEESKAEVKQIIVDEPEKPKSEFWTKVGSLAKKYEKPEIVNQAEEQNKPIKRYGNTNMQSVREPEELDQTGSEQEDRESL
jgi:hypothetical protein